MNWNETLCDLAAGLPEDIARLKAAGWYAEAIAAIDRLLAENWAETQRGGGGPDAPANPMPAAPRALRNSLLAQREIMRRLPAEYPYSFSAGLAKLRAHIPDFTWEELQEMLRAGRIDWRYVEGKKHFAARFYETLVYTEPDFAARAGEPQSGSSRAFRNEARTEMARSGQAAARICLRAAIQPTDEAFAAARAAARVQGRSTVHARVWLPLPAACPSQREIQLLRFSTPPSAIAPEDAPQRTAFWDVELTENTDFWVEYSYVNTARRQDPLSPDVRDTAADRAFLAPEACLGEQLPHIAFTPYLRSLTAQLTADAATPAEKAQRIYDYITLNVKYRFMPAYFVLDNIADNCARSRRGDCGVQALTFVTMCRIAGIPAVWQSGLMVEPQEAGCHDWALFWLEGKGWLYADCSFGGGAAGARDEALRRHYFGNLDPGRMVANRAFQAPLCPPMEGWRNDPYDNQCGEIELEGKGLTAAQRSAGQAVRSYTAL